MTNSAFKTVDKRDLAIGVFDSGLGGISVFNTIREYMPNENLIYYGDSAFAPYGVKSLNFVRNRVDLITEKLLSMGIKALVIACNTATSTSASILREKYDFPILGLEPALKPAVEAGYKNIAVLATEMTLKEKKFQTLMEKYHNIADIQKIPASCLVDIVENDRISFDNIKDCLDNFKLDRESFDAVVLGCTHFIFPKKEISEYFSKAEIFDGNYGLAKNLKNTLESLDLIRKNSENRLSLILNSDSSLIERLEKYAK